MVTTSLIRFFAIKSDTVAMRIDPAKIHIMSLRGGLEMLGVKEESRPANASPPTSYIVPVFASISIEWV